MDVLMPQLGETVAEGKITKWFKSAGDAVKPGDNLFEIETDKTSMEVPATSAGVLTAINVQVGEVAKVGAVVAVISGAGGAAERGARCRRRQRRKLRAPKPGRCAPLPRPSQQSVIKPSGPMDPFFEVRTPERNYGPAKLASGTFVTPLARRLAGERGIDLSRLGGSGPHGRIVAADVEAAIASGAARAAGPQWRSGASPRR